MPAWIRSEPMTGAVAVRSRIVNNLTAVRLGYLGWVSVIVALLVLAPIVAVVINIFLPSQGTLVPPRVHGPTGLHLEYTQAHITGGLGGDSSRRNLGLARDCLSFSRSTRS